MGIKDFMMRQVLKRKLKGMPEAQQQVILEMMETHPDFFKKIGKEIEQKKKQGVSETVAAMQVMREHQAEFQKLMQGR